MLEKYDLIVNSDFNTLISNMEKEAEYCSVTNIYKRIQEKLSL
jgi:hypothetical protein